jgi:hypothetical protein
MAKKIEAIAKGEMKRVIINMPPRHTKSEFASYLLPSWFLGKNPAKKVIQCSNTADLAVGFGRKVRNLVDSEQYASVFPGVKLRQDSKAAGRWATNKNGEYFAIGVGGTVTGKGADLLTTDVWTSMGYEAENTLRMNAFQDWMIDEELMAVAKPDALFMHCLPAHRGEEVSAGVIDGPQSIVWEEAENRLHVQKALMEYLLCGRLS